MGLIYVFLVVLAITATALIARVAARNHVSALDLALSLFGVSMVIGAGVLCWHLPVKLTANAFLFSAMAGLGGSGAVLAFNLAVREGHFGFSNAIYRSSFTIPILYALLFLGEALKPVTLIGIVLILSAIFAMSWSADSFGKGKQAEFRWFLLIMSAFLMSGAPRVGQALTSARGENYYLYLFLSYLFGALILVVVALRKRSYSFASLKWGTGGAVASYIGVLCTLKALETVKAQVVFPISLAGPIILGVVLSLFLFKEKIKALGWLGVVLGIAGISILAIWK